MPLACTESASCQRRGRCGAACGQKGRGPAAWPTLLPLTPLLRGNQARQQVRLAARETAVSTSSPCLGPAASLDIFCIFPNFRSQKISSLAPPPPAPLLLAPPLGLVICLPCPSPPSSSSFLTLQVTAHRGSIFAASPRPQEHSSRSPSSASSST